MATPIHAITRWRLFGPPRDVSGVRRTLPHNNWSNMLLYRMWKVLIQYWAPKNFWESIWISAHDNHQRFSFWKFLNWCDDFRSLLKSGFLYSLTPQGFGSFKTFSEILRSKLRHFRKAERYSIMGKVRLKS